MKITHQDAFNETTHEIEFIEKDILIKEGYRSEQIEGTYRTTGEFGSPTFKEHHDYKEIPIIQSFVICPICQEEILIKETDKLKNKKI